jgi:hypothetical protein
MESKWISSNGTLQTSNEQISSKKSENKKIIEI